MEPEDDVRSRLTSAARRSLDAAAADAWLSMLRPGTRLRAAPGSAGRPGGWLGGLPVLAVGTGWPSWAGHGPLSHIATLDCAQLHRALPAQLREGGFPEAGWLSFFYFDGTADGGIEVVGALFAGTGDGAQVLYTLPGEVSEAAPPAGVTVYPRVEITGEPVLTWATWEHPRLHTGGRPAPGWDQVFAVADQCRHEQQAMPAHQVGGNPDPVQGPIELEVAYGQVSRGGQDKIAWTDPAVRVAAEDWLLLGQFDTDSQVGFLWGDCGVLYYLIRPADLVARRFDRVAFTWQCG